MKSHGRSGPSNPPVKNEGSHEGFNAYFVRFLDNHFAPFGPCLNQIFWLANNFKAMFWRGFNPHTQFFQPVRKIVRKQGIQQLPVFQNPLAIYRSDCPITAQSRVHQECMGMGLGVVFARRVMQKNRGNRGGDGLSVSAPFPASRLDQSLSVNRA